MNLQNERTLLILHCISSFIHISDVQATFSSPSNSRENAGMKQFWRPLVATIGKFYLNNVILKDA